MGPFAFGRFALALAALASGACASSAHGPFDEKRVLELPSAVDDGWVTVSPHGRGAAYAERRGWDAYVLHQGRRIGPYP